jgi:glycosyltransferase involved in cell wall biosynthesis
MSEPEVSILVATCSRPESLSLAIATIAVQRFQGWELLVVHDGDCRETSELVRSYQARDRRVKYFHREHRTGIAAAMNFGLENARGRYVAILDDDDLWIDTEKLGLQARFLNDHPDYVACGGGAIVIDESGQETMRHLKPQPDDAIRRVALVANPLIHSAMMYRRDRAVSVGGYDSTLKGFHDWDLWLRLGRKGRFFNFQRYFAGYRVWEGSGSSKSARDNARSAVRIVWRHRSHYEGFPKGLAMAWGYRAFAALPPPVRRSSFGMLSRLKKRVFSSSQPKAETRWSPDDLDRLINGVPVSNGFPRDTGQSSELIRGL